MAESTPGILDIVDRLRATIEKDAEYVLALKENPFFNQPTEGANTGEMIANIMLSYRHLEDARMRLGKVIQAHDGGKSVYDKK